MSMGNTGQSTVGAGKSGALDKARFGPDSKWFFPLVGLVLALVSPVAVTVYAAMALIGQKRRVRTSRFVAGAALVTVLGFVVGWLNGGPLGMFQWHAQGTTNLWWGLGLGRVAQFVVDFTVGWAGVSVTAPPAARSVLAALVMTTPLAVPVGAWLGSIYSAWMAFRRAPLTNLEDPQFQWHRPAGFWDHRRAVASRHAIETGAAIDRKRGTIGVGIGLYGALVRLHTATLIRAVLIFGGPRQGKTRLALSLIAQAAVDGSGWVCLDFKGDGEIPAFMAEYARTHNRRFLHFQLADKNGGPYRRPGPAAPPTPAFYEPLMRGNATSRADMLINSVGREGDAAAYFRAAYDLAQVVYQVADVVGYGAGLGGFQILEDLLDLDMLQQVADTVGPDGRALLADHPKLAARVEALVQSVRGDQVLKGAIGDTRRTLSTYGNGPAAGPWLRPGPPAHAINLYRAVKEGDIVVFSLPVQDYGDLARNIGTLILLDLQNTITELRADLTAHREHRANTNATPPWKPCYVQIEEFGSAGQEAILGVLNKSGDVLIRPFLSTQSYNDVVAVDGTGVFAERVLDQAGNIFSFAVVSEVGAKVLSGVTPEVTKASPRDTKEFSGGVSGMGLKAANMGKLQVLRETVRQVEPGAFQTLGTYRFLWVSMDPKRVTHTFKPSAGRWWEVITSVPVPADVAANPAPTGPNQNETVWAPPEYATRDTQPLSAAATRPLPVEPAAIPDEPPVEEPPPDPWNGEDRWNGGRATEPPQDAQTLPVPPKPVVVPRGSTSNKQDQPNDPTQPPAFRLRFQPLTPDEPTSSKPPATLVQTSSDSPHETGEGEAPSSRNVGPNRPAPTAQNGPSSPLDLASFGEL